MAGPTNQITVNLNNRRTICGESFEGDLVLPFKKQGIDLYS